MLSRDLQRVLKIRDYCLSIQDTMSRFGVSLEGFLSDSDYQQSIAFSVLQIGELTSGLSEVHYTAFPEKNKYTFSFFVSISRPVSAFFTAEINLLPESAGGTGAVKFSCAVPLFAGFSPNLMKNFIIPP